VNPLEVHGHLSVTKPKKKQRVITALEQAGAQAPEPILNATRMNFPVGSASVWLLPLRSFFSPITGRG